MSVRRIIFAILVPALLLAGGCKSSTGPGASDQIPLIPLAIGNEWDYVSSGSNPGTTTLDTMRIIADSVIDGELWYVQQGSIPVNDLTYMTTRNDGLWRYHAFWRDEIVRYLHYPIALNDDNEVNDDVINVDSSSYRVTLHTVVTALHKSVTVPAGTYDCVEVALKWNGDAALGPNCGVPAIYEYYSPGVGLIAADYYSTSSTKEATLYYRRALARVQVR